MPGNRPIQSCERLTRILYAVAGTEDGATVRQIADAVGIRPNTAYRFIRSLEQEKLLNRRRNPIRFTLGPAISELKRLDDDRQLLALSARVLTRSHAQVPEANLALLERDGLDVYQRLFFRSGRPGRVERRRQYVMHPYSKASSILFLAYSEADEEELFFRRHSFEKEGRPYWKTRQELRDFLARVRRLGRCQPHFPDHNWFRLAVPIFSPGHEVIAVIGGYISKDYPRSSQKLLARLCIEAGREITRRFAEETADDSGRTKAGSERSTGKKFGA